MTKDTDGYADILRHSLPCIPLLEPLLQHSNLDLTNASLCPSAGLHNIVSCIPRIIMQGYSSQSLA